MCATPNAIGRRLVAYLARRFPAWTATSVSGVKGITTGWETENYVFSLSYTQDAQQRHRELVLRIYPGIGAATKAEREFQAMRQLRVARYPAPEGFVLETGRSPLQRPFLIMEKIPGRPLTSIMEGATCAHRQQLLALFCRLLVQLHDLDWHPFVHDPSRRRPEAVVERELRKLRQCLNRFGRHELDPVAAWLWERRSQVEHPQLAVVHGDYHPANVLLKDDGSPVVIDWGGVDVTDYRFDLAWTLLLADTYDSPAGRERVLAEYERLAGRRVEEIAYFEVAAILRRLFTFVASAVSGAGTIGMRPGAEAMIGQNVESVRRTHAVLHARTGITIPEVDRLIASLQ